MPTQCINVFFPFNDKDDIVQRNILDELRQPIGDDVNALAFLLIRASALAELLQLPQWFKS